MTIGPDPHAGYGFERMRHEVNNSVHAPYRGGPGSTHSYATHVRGSTAWPWGISHATPVVPMTRYIVDVFFSVWSENEKGDKKMKKKKKTKNEKKTAKRRRKKHENLSQSFLAKKRKKARTVRPFHGVRCQSEK